MKLTKKEKGLVKKSIKHWKEDIVSLLETADSLPANYPLRAVIGETIVKIPCYADSCPLCEEYINIYGDIECHRCPLARAGFECGKFNSPWVNFIGSGSNIQKVKIKAKEMIQVMEFLLKEV